MPKQKQSVDLDSTLFLMSDDTQDSEMISPEPMITDLSDTQMLFQSQSTTVGDVSPFTSQDSNASTLVPSQPLSQSSSNISVLDDTIALMEDSTDSRYIHGPYHTDQIRYISINF